MTNIDNMCKYFQRSGEQLWENVDFHLISDFYEPLSIQQKCLMRKNKPMAYSITLG